MCNIFHRTDVINISAAKAITHLMLHITHTAISPLSDISKSSVMVLQPVQNIASKMIIHIYQHIASILGSLQRPRCEFLVIVKLVLLTLPAIHGDSTKCLVNSAMLYHRISCSNVQPQVSWKWFVYQAGLFWNELPFYVRNIKKLSIFESFA